MKISLHVLRRYLSLPGSAHEIREIMEDVGLEVKRTDERTEGGTIFTLELLANRGDHHCYEGVARELSGRTGASLTRPPVAVLTIGPSPIRLSCETDKCLLYTATLLERTEAERPFDAATLLPLTAADIHSLSAAVDATNLSNHELGQPTHAFDADAIVGGITIRESRRGETAWLLFQTEKTEVPEGTIVIADDAKILAIAGVIGCEESKTTASTKRLILESACFDPVSVRKAGRALDIQTDSRARFERGSDPTYAVVGAGRVTHLLETVGWRHIGTTGQVGSWTDPKRRVRCDLGVLNQFLETQLVQGEVDERLRRYGFTLHWGSNTAFDVSVPPHRLWDVEHWADIAEELAKSVGYNATPTTLPSVDMGAAPSPLEVAKEKTEEVLLAHGFYEVFTDGFHGKALDDAMHIGAGHPLSHHVETLNSVERSSGLLKNNALAQALDMVAENQRRQQFDLRAYEWTRTFHPDADAENGVCRERLLVWAIAIGAERTWAGAGRPSDVHLFKGLVEELGTALGLPLVVGAWDDREPLSSCMHPGRRGAIHLGERSVGIIGEVHPELVKSFKIRRGSPVYLEVEQAALSEAGTLVSYAPPPIHQPIQRSLAFGLVGVVPAGAVIDVLRAAGPEFLTGVVATDLFQTTDADGPVRAVTFELLFDNDGLRSAESINGHLEALVRAVESRLPGVRQRA